MAAVLALIMLPLIAAFGCFGGLLHADGSVAAAFAGVMFFALATFMLASVLRVVRQAEGPEH